MASHRIRHLDELDLEPTSVGEPAAQRSNTETLGGVVPRRDVVNPVLGGLVENPLRRFAGDVGVETRRHRLVVLALGGTGDDPHRGDQSSVALEDLRLAIGDLGDGREELDGVDRFGKDPADAGRGALVLGKRLELTESEQPGELGGVAQLHVPVQRQVVRDQRDVVGQQKPDPLAEGADQSRRLAPVPQQTMVDDDGVGPAVDGPGEQSARRGHRGHHALDIGRTLDLQPVGAVVPHGVGIENFIEIRDELVEIHDQIVPQQRTVYGGKDVRILSRLTRIFALAAAGILVVSCGPSQPPQEDGFRVRLLTSVTLSGRWERAAERGLGLIAAELDADVARSRAAGTADQRSRLRALAADGVDLVFCVGPDVESLVYTEAAAFPDTDFVVIPGEIHNGNVGSVAFTPEEVGYLAGTVAAAVTEGTDIGLLRGSGRPWLARLETGFTAGFRSIHPAAEVVASGGLEGPWRLTDAGVEVALYATDRVDPQILAAAHDAGLFLIGSDPSLLEAEPDFVIAAVEIDVAEAMLRIAREVHDLSFSGKVYAFDLGSGVLDVKLNPSFASPGAEDDLRETLERARSEITAGWVEIEELGIGR